RRHTRFKCDWSSDVCSSDLNLNKIYFPESGYTKRHLLAYYYRMADYILPFLKGRALVLRRYPDGINGQAFFQKDLHEGVPEWFRSEERRVGKECKFCL